MVNGGTLEERFLGELYGLAEGQTTRVVSGEELARRLSIDPEGETDKARFLGTAGVLRRRGTSSPTRLAPTCATIRASL